MKKGPIYFLSWLISLVYVCMHPKAPLNQDTSFVIITASYNNEEWYRRNLESILNQDYDNWRLIYINDCSTDDTYNGVQTLIQDYGL